MANDEHQLYQYHPTETKIYNGVTYSGMVPTNQFQFTVLIGNGLNAIISAVFLCFSFLLTREILLTLINSGQLALKIICVCEMIKRFGQNQYRQESTTIYNF